MGEVHAPTRALEASERFFGARHWRLLLGFLILGSVAALEALRAGLTPPLLVGEPDSALPEWGNAALALAAFLGPVFAPSAPRRWAIALLVLGPLWGVLNVAAGGTNVPWIALAIGVPLLVPPLLRLARAQTSAALEEDAALRLRRLRQGAPGWVMIYFGCAGPLALATLCIALLLAQPLIPVLGLLFGPLRTVEGAFEETWNSPVGDLTLFVVPGRPLPASTGSRPRIVDRLEVRLDDSVEQDQLFWFQLADGSELITRFHSQGDPQGPWSASWSSREHALLPTFRSFQAAFERGDGSTLLTLMTPDLAAQRDTDLSWCVRHAPQRVFALESDVTGLGYFFEEERGTYRVESQWAQARDGWRLEQLSVEHVTPPAPTD